MTNEKKPERHMRAMEAMRAMFHHRVPIQIRFNDVDRLGHVNNNAYFAYYDLGKQEYLKNVLQIDYDEADVVSVVANINADFFAPIFYGDQVVVETRISNLGQKSFTLEQQAVNEQTGDVVCRCSTVMVCYSLREKASADIPEKYRRAIEEFENK